MPKKCVLGKKLQDFEVINIRSEIHSIYLSEDKKVQEFRHIYIYSIVNVTSVAFIAPIPKIFVIKVAILQLESVRYQQRHNLLAYMMYVCSILSLQCIIGRFSAVL